MKVLKPKAIENASNNKPVITQKFYDKILEERMDEILKMSDKIGFNNLIYNLKGPTSSINFVKFGGPMYIYGHMKNCDTKLNEITSGNPKHKSNSQLYVIENVKNLKTKIIDMLNDNSIWIRSEAIYKSRITRTGLKILTPKQMLQRLPVALAQVSFYFRAIIHWFIKWNQTNCLIKILCIN